MSETKDRVVIDDWLRASGWILTDHENSKRNVDFEVRGKGINDYTLYDSKGFPICVLEAKSLEVSRNEGGLLSAKEQTRRYAKAQKCRFAMMSNGETHYLWDTHIGNPVAISICPSQKELEIKDAKYKPDNKKIFEEEIQDDYIVKTQFPNYEKNPDYIKPENRENFIKKNNLRFLRPYQLNALKAIQESTKKGNDRFLLEMATGTGKTLTSCAIIKLFLRSANVKRVLFLVDRLELETQAEREFKEVLKNDYTVSIWKEKQTSWKSSEIVVTTVQSLKAKNKYKIEFNRDDFDLVISDESHRSLGGQSKKVFEYFIGYKLGLTATPKDYLKNINQDQKIMDPRELERRTLLDTYTTFGCESGNPTFRYSLIDGVRDGFLINPKVFDARTDLTTQLLSENGYSYTDEDEDGNVVSAIFTRRQYEKTFFSEDTNRTLCKAFLDNAKKDPFSEEIGKSLIFCVSQDHAGKIVQILNELAHELFPNKYQSDFAMQVTSRVDRATEMTLQFKNNNLGGNSDFNPYYKTSKSRVCVTVGMMTTGYDCTDLLNICLLRPVFSPSDFIQMKGRGTRKNDFTNHWIDKKKVPEDIVSDKSEFFLFDFFANCEFFEKDFSYNEKLQLPNPGSITTDGPIVKNPEKAENYNPDPLATMRKSSIGKEGMKIDRMFFDDFAKIVKSDSIIEGLINERDFDKAEQYLNDNILDRPEKFFTLDKLKKSIGLDRRLNTKELLLYIFGHTNILKTREELLEDEFEKFDNRYSPEQEIFNDIKHVFVSYLTDPELREIIDRGEFVRLNNNPNGIFFKKLPDKFKNVIPEYIKDHVHLNKFLK